MTSPTDQIAALAEQINKPALSFDPGQFRKGNVVGIDLGDDSTPPTVTVLLSGDTTVPIVGVRLNADYSPQMGDMVILAKQGAEMFALCAIATLGSVITSSSTGGWTKATLRAGKAHNGNANGDVMYRRILEDGCWKMQWKGGFTYDGNTTVLAAVLDPEFCPSSKQSLIVHREVATGGGVAVGIDFLTTGGVSVVAPTWSSSATGGQTTSATAPGTDSIGGQTTSATAPGTDSIGGQTTSAASPGTDSTGTGASGSASPGTDSVDPLDTTTTGGTADPHTHGVTGSHSHTVTSHTHTGPSHSHTVNSHTHTNGSHAHTVNSHTHTNGSHAHTVNSHTHTNGSHAHTATDPTWIALSGVEYFL